MSRPVSSLTNKEASKSYNIVFESNFENVETQLIPGGIEIFIGTDNVLTLLNDGVITTSEGGFGIVAPDRSMQYNKLIEYLKSAGILNF